MVVLASLPLTESSHRQITLPNCKPPAANCLGRASGSMTLRCCMGDYCIPFFVCSGEIAVGEVPCHACEGFEFLGPVENMQRKEGLSASAA